jgi:hypothetical protein
MFNVDLAVLFLKNIFTKKKKLLDKRKIKNQTIAFRIRLKCLGVTPK